MSRTSKPTLASRTRPGGPTKSTGKPTPAIAEDRFHELVEAAIVDAYSESEKVTGWFAVLEDHVELPFETDIFGVRVNVTAVDLRDHDTDRGDLCARQGAARN